MSGSASPAIFFGERQNPEREMLEIYYQMSYLVSAYVSVVSVRQRLNAMHRLPGIIGTVVRAPMAHPSRMKISGRDFWTQTTQNARSTQINIRVFCVPYSVTKGLAIFGTLNNCPQQKPPYKRCRK
jgi:hypothetical protein